MSWHADRDLLAAYARGSVDDARALSLEAHLIACAGCRARATTFVDVERRERVWAEVDLALRAPRPGFVERLLLRCGVREDTARILAATPSLSLAWLLAVALALAFAVIAARQGENGVLMFLVLAPLLPVAGVAAAYAPGLDPAFEVAICAPLRSFRLLLIRAVAVTSSTVLLAALSALALPGLEWTLAAWLVPALALTSMSLALSTWMRPVAASASLTVVWITTVVVAAIASDDRFAAFRAPVQVALLLAGLVAALVVAQRREHFDIGREI